jgi:O-antigen ligase
LLRLAYGVLWLLLLLAPLFRSGKVPLAELALQLLAVLGLVIVFWGGERHVLHRPRGALLWFSLGLLLLPIVYLLPLPGLSLLSLPGRDELFAVSEWIGREAPTMLTFTPRATLASLFTLLLPLGVFWLTVALPGAQVKSLLYWVLAIAAVQAVLGLLQFALGGDSWAYLGMNGGMNAQGTWTSRNNFAGFMHLNLMVVLALFMGTLGRYRQQRRDDGLRNRFLFFSTLAGHRAFIFGALSLLILMAAVFSRSRAGIGASMIGLVLVAVVFSRRIGGNNAFGLTGSVISVGLLLAVTIGLGPVLQRFTLQDPASDGRWSIFAGAWQGIGEFFPWGAGPGSFVHVYPAYQDLVFAGRFMNRAHNSYLEWLFDGGLLAGALLIVGLVLYGLRWRTVLAGKTWGEFQFIQAGAGLGMLLTLLHDMVDYNLFIPANQVFFAFCAGIFFHRHVDHAARPRRQSKGQQGDSSRSRRRGSPSEHPLAALQAGQKNTSVAIPRHRDNNDPRRRPVFKQDASPVFDDNPFGDDNSPREQIETSGGSERDDWG